MDEKITLQLSLAQLRELCDEDTPCGGQHDRLSDEVERLQVEVARLKSESSPPFVGGVERRVQVMRELISDTIFRNKISMIKAVREVTGLGLKDAKDLVESVDKRNDGRWVDAPPPPPYRY